jgi:hypothetical protein
MPIVTVFQSPEFTQELYEESVRQLTGGSDRMRSPADWPVEGLLVHIAGDPGSGFRVVDVWESEEAFRRFGQKLAPVMKAIGIEAQPEIYPAHTLVAAGRSASSATTT